MDVLCHVYWPFLSGTDSSHIVTLTSATVKAMDVEEDDNVCIGTQKIVYIYMRCVCRNNVINTARFSRSQENILERVHLEFS